MHISYDPSQKKVTVRDANDFPQQVLDYVDDMEILDMSFGHLRDLPDVFGKCKKLRVAFFSNNDFETVPDVFAACPSLEMVGLKSCKIRTIPDRAFPKSIKAIILTGNRIEQLPASIGEYKELKKIMLAGNKLRSLPKELLQCKELQLLRLPLNELEVFATWILELPKLGWYNDGANPFHTNDRMHLEQVKTVLWKDISIGEKLGQSASNEVFHGTLKDGTEVAVKLFGGALTTDGLAIDDMNACLLAGEHPNIIGGIAKVVDTPDNKPSLVMPLIPKDFTKLGNPPSFTSFTRDTFPQDKRFTVPFIIQVLKDVTAAMIHLHQKGIMHGDLYAHNVLSDHHGKSYLGDFGAASLYEPGSEDGKLRELTDVKSFGYLIDDLLQRCDDTNISALESLREKCFQKIVTERPTFAEIHETL